jgi:hemerythrin-like metal-binding protein
VTLLLSWNRACNVGVQAMDDQHAIMMDTMNELRLALVHGAKQVQADELLNKLIEFTRMHFWGEEQLMEQHGFPGLAGHRAEHQRLMAQLQKSVRRLQRGEAVQTSDLLCFLHDWFIDHVEGLDQQYGPWLNKHGVY